MEPKIPVALCKGLLIVAFALAHGAVLVPARAETAPAGLAVNPGRAAALASLPLSFEENFGQAGAHDVQYFAHGNAFGIALTQQGALITLSAGAGHAMDVPPAASDQIRILLQGAQASPAPRAEQVLPGRVNYFIGNDPSKWHTDVATYGRVRYDGVYPGVDLVYYGNQGHLEYDFAVAPGANPQIIGVHFEGAQRLSIDAQGNLQIDLAGRRLAFERPVAYQFDGGQRRAVTASYRLAGDSVGFEIGSFDHAKALVIDPVLSYFTYIGGSNTDVIGIAIPQSGSTAGQALALDASGNVYVTGYSVSTDFPQLSPFAPPTAKQNPNGGWPWAFVSKLSADGSRLLYSTYVGGSARDYGQAIAADALGNVFIVGWTESNDFPVTAGAFQVLCAPNYTNSPNAAFASCAPAASQNAFIAKFSQANGQLLAATFLGGTSTQNSAGAVAVDAAGNVYVTGNTIAGQNGAAPGQNKTLGFPTTANALLATPTYPTQLLGDYDAFVSILDPTLSALLYSTLIGDTQIYNFPNPQYQGPTNGTAVTVDASGNTYVGGWTTDGFLPTTSNALIPAASGCGQLSPGTTALSGRCGFVAKFSPLASARGPALTYGTYLGGEPVGAGSFTEQVTGIAADASGNAYVSGFTNNAGFPSTSGAYQTTCDGYIKATNTGDSNCSAAFVAKLNPAGTALLASTYYGCVTCSGDPVFEVGAVVLDAAGNVYVTGIGVSGLAQRNPVQTVIAGSTNPFVAEFDSALTTLKFATVFGTGAQQVSAGGLAVDVTGNIFVAGNANVNAASAATSGAYQTSYGGGSSDGWVAKISGLATGYAIPWFTEYPGYVSRFVFLNTGTSPATYTIAVNPEVGNTVVVNPNFATGTIAAQSQLVINASDLMPSIALKPRASAQITTGGTDLSVYGIYNLVQPATGSITNTSLLPATDFSSTSSMLEAPFFTTASSYSGDFVFSNTGLKAVTGTVTLLSTVGNSALPGQSTFQIAPGSEFDLPASSVISGYAQATGPSVAGALFSFNAPEGYVKGIYKTVSIASGAVGTSELVNPQNATSTPTVLIAPWFTTYPGYNSTFYLTNRGSQAATVAISVMTEAGNAATLGTTNWTLPANSQLAIPAKSVVSSFMNNTRGSAIFTIGGPTNNIEGLYQVTNLSTGAMSNTPMSRPSSSTGSTPYVVPWFTTYPGYVSRFVFVNRSAQAAPFTVRVLPETGNAATLNQTAGSIPAQSMYVLDASSVVTGFSAATRAGAVFQVSLPDNSVDALYNVVNPGSGVVSNTRLTH